MRLYEKVPCILLHMARRPHQVKKKAHGSGRTDNWMELPQPQPPTDLVRILAVAFEALEDYLAVEQAVWKRALRRVPPDQHPCFGFELVDKTLECLPQLAFA